MSVQEILDKYEPKDIVSAAAKIHAYKSVEKRRESGKLVEQMTKASKLGLEKRWGKKLSTEE